MVPFRAGRPAGCVLGLQFCAMLVGHLGTVAAGAERTQVEAIASREAVFQIAAQPLATALIEFSDQAHLQVISSGEEVANSLAGEVRGRRRIVDALEIMLKGTNLRYTVVSQDIISIHPAAPT